jgi:DNA-binding Lrp family transcriptional regulator
VSTSTVSLVPLDDALLRELRQAGRKTEEWREKRDDLIRQAHLNGGSLREIAAAVGLSNPGVLRIVKKGTSEAPPLVLDRLTNVVVTDSEEDHP